MIKNITKLFGLTIGLIMSLSAFAWEPIVGVRAGVNWIDVSQNDVNTVGKGDDRYKRDTNETNVGWGAFAGAEWEVADEWFVQAGLSYDLFDRTNIDGDITLWGEPDQHEFDYQYKLLHQRANAEFKLLKEWRRWYPYLTGALGIAWNKTSDYKETSHDPYAPASDYLEGETSTQFTWSVGAGVERELTDNWRVGLGYLYTDAGSAELKSKVTGDTLEQKFSTQQLVLQINYIF
jgi:opacity protein-like surface antigen